MNSALTKLIEQDENAVEILRLLRLLSKVNTAITSAQKMNGKTITEQLISQKEQFIK